MWARVLRYCVIEIDGLMDAYVAGTNTWYQWNGMQFVATTAPLY
jgi:hypothetical protein